MSKTITTTAVAAAGAHFFDLLTDPNAPRALLVTLGSGGQLQQQAVNNGQSVVNLETELQDHLSASPRTTEWLLALRDYIDCRLAARAEAQATSGFCIPRQDGGWNIAHVNAFETLTAGGAAA